MTTRKAIAVFELAHQLRSGPVIVTGYRGLTTAQLTALRRELKGHASLKVVKNTLARRAAEETGVNLGVLQGPTALVLISGDAARTAKILVTFAKASPLLEIKGGVLGSKTLTPADTARLAGLGSREEVLATLAGTLTALPARMAMLAEALRVKREGEADEEG